MIIQEKIQKKAEGFGRLAPAFLEGAEFALNNQWISVDEDLPCNHEELLDLLKTEFVITLNSRKRVEINYMIDGLNGWKWAVEKSNILYWFPIPELPKE